MPRLYSSEIEVLLSSSGRRWRRIPTFWKLSQFCAEEKRKLKICFCWSVHVCKASQIVFLLLKKLNGLLSMSDCCHLFCPFSNLVLMVSPGHLVGPIRHYIPSHLHYMKIKITWSSPAMMPPTSARTQSMKGIPMIPKRRQNRRPLNVRAAKLP